MFQARFRSEAALAARLHEPHVIPIHDFGEIDGQLYIDMRLVEGPDLATVLRAGPLPPHRVVDIITQVASALDAAHAAGLVHRDIKPANILVTGPSRARPVATSCTSPTSASPGLSMAARPASLTSTGNMVGSLDYIAPERFDRDPGDRRVDIYALGCVLFQALTGRRPFPVEGLPAIINAHLNTPPPAASARPPERPGRPGRGHRPRHGQRSRRPLPHRRRSRRRRPPRSRRRNRHRRAGSRRMSPRPPESDRTTSSPWLDNVPWTTCRWSPDRSPPRPVDRPRTARAATPAVVGGMPGPSEPPVACPGRGADRRPRARRGRVVVGVGVRGDSDRGCPGHHLGASHPDHPTGAAEHRTVPGASSRPGLPQSGRGPAVRTGAASEPSGDQRSPPPPCTVHIAIGGLSSITVGVAWSATLAADGCRSPYTWSVVGGTLPAGINLRPDGTLAGTATGPGTPAVVVEATSADGVSATRHLTTDRTIDRSPRGDDRRGRRRGLRRPGHRQIPLRSTRHPAKGDLNGDKTVNITDMSMLLSDWTGGSGACNTDQPLAN